MFEAFYLYGKHSIRSWREVLGRPPRPRRHLILAQDDDGQAPQIDTNRDHFNIYHCLIHCVPLSCPTAYCDHVEATPLQLHIHLTIRRIRDR
jgi:hypothetical protein